MSGRPVTRPHPSGARRAAQTRSSATQAAGVASGGGGTTKTAPSTRSSTAACSGARPVSCRNSYTLTSMRSAKSAP
eukprot:scaffold85894_cov67-Phaeocystis_antarctica.AAC.3